MTTRSIRPIRSLMALGCALALLAGCRRDPNTVDATPPTDPFGGAGNGYFAQCSGWFPDWISRNPPPPGTASFQLAQGYPLGVPVFGQVNGQTVVTGWNPPSPGTGPWSTPDFRIAAQRPAYLDALKNYLLEGMVDVDFVAQANRARRWYHVPMMTTSPSSRREPYRGLTKERPLSAADHAWILPGQSLDSFAIGYYNATGGYTIGQVFKDPDPAQADPSKAQFIDGTYVFKLLFAEYDAAKVNAQYPLDGAPTWQVQDVENPSAPLKTVRLIQVDVAVKDPRSTQTGWVFATFVYDENMSAEPVPWRRLKPIGLQWGNDPDVTGPGIGTLDETWISPGIPAAFQNTLGRHGRLNGPVDNPVSSCISCHSTAQVSPGAASLRAFRGARLIPPAACSNTQDMTWFRNLLGNERFGLMTSNGDGCDLAPTQPTALVSTDYSLQLADGLESSLFRRNPNPCQATAQAMRQATDAATEGDDANAAQSDARRATATRIGRIALDPALVRALETPADENEAHRR